MNENHHHVSQDDNRHRAFVEAQEEFDAQENFSQARPAHVCFGDLRRCKTGSEVRSLTRPSGKSSGLKLPQPVGAPLKKSAADACIRWCG